MRDGDVTLIVSSLGRVASLERIATGLRAGRPITQRRRSQIISPWVARNGYLTVSLQIGSYRRKLLVHRLVARAFVAGEFAGATVNHIDGVKLHNVPSNLEWVTRAHNTHLQWEMGLIDLRGERNPNSKLNAVDVRMILDLLAAGHKSQSIASRFGVSARLVDKIGRGERLP